MFWRLKHDAIQSDGFIFFGVFSWYFTKLGIDDGGMMITGSLTDAVPPGICRAPKMFLRYWEGYLLRAIRYANMIKLFTLFNIGTEGKWKTVIYLIHTIGGRNPAPTDMVTIPLFTELCTSKRWLFGFSEPSTVWMRKLFCVFDANLSNEQKSGCFVFFFRGWDSTQFIYRDYSKPM